MSRRPLLILAASAALAVAGCSNAVELDTPGGSSGTFCRGLLTDLPSAVAGEERREVEPVGSGGAWGDPPIIVQCGVPKPAGLDPTSRCAEINGVGWFSDKNEDGYVFTTIGRETYVRVTVPAEYEPPADALVDLAGAIKEHDPVVQECV